MLGADAGLHLNDPIVVASFTVAATGALGAVTYVFKQLTAHARWQAEASANQRAISALVDKNDSKMDILTDAVLVHHTHAADQDARFDEFTKATAQELQALRRQLQVAARPVGPSKPLG